MPLLAVFIELLMNDFVKIDYLKDCDMFSKPRFVLFLPFFLAALFLAGCSSKSIFPDRADTLQWKNLNLSGLNKFPSEPRSALVHNDEIVIGFNNGAIVKWHLSNGQLLKVFNTENTLPKRTLIYSDPYILSGSSNMKMQKWSKNGELIKEKLYEKGTVFKIIEADQNLYVGFGNAELGVVDPKSLDLIASYRGHEYLIYALCFDKEKQLLLSGSDDNSVISWKVLDNGFLEKIGKTEGFTNAVRGIIKVDNNYVVTTGDGKIILYNEQMKKVSESQVHTGIVVSSTSINKFLFTGDSFGNLYIHKIINDQLLPYKKYKLNGAIRIVEKTKNAIVAISKNGDIRIVHTDELNKKTIGGPQDYIAGNESAL